MIIPNISQICMILKILNEGELLMKIVTAIEDFKANSYDVVCFLAGGITKCWNWQDEVIKELAKYKNTEKLVICNPRRPNFPIHDPNASEDQIRWEFKWLERCDIFSMYFSESESVQPICMYELGRNLFRMQIMYPGTYKDRIAITCEEGYSRIQDVKIQSKLALGFDALTPDPSAKAHAKRIIDCYTNVVFIR